MGAKVVNLVSAKEVAAGCEKQYVAHQKDLKAKVEKRLSDVKARSEELKRLAKTIQGLKSQHDSVMSRQGAQLAQLAAQVKKKKKR